jgi:hypothetical protein
MQLAERLFALTCALAALVAGALLAVPASAGAHGTSTRLHIRQVSGHRAYHGRVISPRRACMKDRHLRVYRDVTGRPDNVVARATSDARGMWRTAVPYRRYHPADFYYARVAPEKSSGGTCAGAKSAYAQAIA